MKYNFINHFNREEDVCSISHQKGFTGMRKCEQTGKETSCLRKRLFTLPVDHIPGHSQHASHPGATHHPAAHKEGSDVDRLQAQNCSNVEVNRFHKILFYQGKQWKKTKTVNLKKCL